MRKLLFSILTLTLLTGSAFAQTEVLSDTTDGVVTLMFDLGDDPKVNVPPEAEPYPKNVGYVLIDTDNNGDVKFRGGIGIPLWGPIMQFTYITAGKYGEFDTETGVFKRLGKFGAGVIIGPHVDMTKSDGTKAVTYLPFVAGVVFSADLYESFGLLSYAKYKFSVGADSYVDGWYAGGGMKLGF